ncbi:MAG: hypothetical protein MRY63_06030 [Neomegalonema sp.]|nr:hypothetical protein [Neomegalonema sp.]
MSFDDPEQLRAKSPEEITYDQFSPRVAEKLGYYVYRLIDPRDGSTFYVGRGVDNRIFDHMDEAFEGRRSEKTDRISAIHRAGYKVVTVIHRHALRDQEEAAVVEAALIEAFPNLTNQVSGEGTRLYGCRDTDKVIGEYDLPPANFAYEKCLILSISSHWPKIADDAPTSWSDIYARARHGWALDVGRAAKADWIVVEARGIIRAIFTAERWLSADDPTFAAFPRAQAGAYSFIGQPASFVAWESWQNRRVPNRYRPHWGSVVRYVNI